MYGADFEKFIYIVIFIIFIISGLVWWGVFEGISYLYNNFEITRK